MGADKIVAIDVLHKRNKEMLNAVGMLPMIERYNYRTARRREENAGIIDLWLEPELGDMSQYSFKKFPYAFDQGYKLGVEYAPKIKELLG
ncbi:MAG: hypothetical protein ACLRSW_14960 [Christensenellaceae bacterium]